MLFPKNTIRFTFGKVFFECNAELIKRKEANIALRNKRMLP